MLKAGSWFNRISSWGRSCKEGRVHAMEPGSVDMGLGVVNRRARGRRRVGGREFESSRV